MFDSIKDALNKSNTVNKTADILRTKPGNSYEVRLLPNVEDPSKTFYHYYSHAWESFSTGQYITALSPTTWGDRDPIAEMRFQAQRTGTEQEKGKASAVIRREQWLVNVYVVNDPTDPDNNDTVKILRFGRQLHKIIMDAIEGEDADQFGPRIFDLGKDGSSFRIRCDKQGDFPTYVSSKFLLPKPLDGVDAKRTKEVYTSGHDLETVFKARTYDELNKMLQEHYYCNDGPVQEVSPPSNDFGRKDLVTEDDDDDVPMEFDKKKEPEAETDADPLEDDKIKELLAGLDDD
ncbi:hypothetical protein CL634_09815 [bacterium]|nr:hypothetical protein [bacterium]